MHLRAALRNGVTPEELREVLMHVAVYAGVPAANSAFALAARVLRAEGALPAAQSSPDAGTDGTDGTDGIDGIVG
jgi:hypothetical protein